MTLLRPARTNGRRARKRRRGANSLVREEITALHRAIFRSNQARINLSVSGYTDAFRDYERDYTRSVRTYERRATFVELDRELAKANIAYVGDYHTLQQAQRSFLRLMRRLPQGRPVVIALELVSACDQTLLDAYLAGEVSNERFVEVISRHAEWVQGGWSNIRDLFALARERGYRVVGIDSRRRGPAGNTLAYRDRFSAKVIARERRKRPAALIMVLVGELHVARSHLPRRVDEQLGDLPSRSLAIYQNCESIYRELERRGLENEVEIVRIRGGEYCLNNTPPIVCQQSFLNWIDFDEASCDFDAPEENFKQYARIIADFFDLPLGNELDEVEITTVADLSFLSRLRQRGDFSASDVRRIKQQILRSESYWIPRARVVYLGNPSINHATEEATHFIRHACAASYEPKLLVDAFYSRCLEEAIGFLGSKIVNPRRKCAHAPHFERVLRSRNASATERELAHFVLMHLRMEAGRRVRGLRRVYETDADMFNAVTHVLGYRLGDALFYGLISGAIAKDEIRNIFFDPFEDEGSALSTYIYFTARTRDVRIPERVF